VILRNAIIGALHIDYVLGPAHVYNAYHMFHVWQGTMIAKASK